MLPYSSLYPSPPWTVMRNTNKLISYFVSGVEVVRTLHTGSLISFTSNHKMDGHAGLKNFVIRGASSDDGRGRTVGLRAVCLRGAGEVYTKKIGSVYGSVYNLHFYTVVYISVYTIVMLETCIEILVWLVIR